MRNRTAGWGIFLCGLLGCALLTAAEKRTITHEDVWLMKRVSAPSVSPDGKWAVFSVLEPAYDPKEVSSDLWLRALNGDQPPRRITATKTPESGVAWSPDSQRIAFSAKRDGDEAAQIYVLDLVLGGEAERITQISTGARAARWSPNGKQILFVSDVFPGARDDEANKKIARERKDRKYTVRAYDGFPIRDWDRWTDDKHPHVFVQDAKSGVTPRDLLAGTKLAERPGFAGRGGDVSGDELDAVWTPNGKAVVFAARLDSDKQAYSQAPAQLFEVSVEGGEPRQLTEGDDHHYRPTFSPDGRALLAMTEQGGDEMNYHLERIARFPWPFDRAKRAVLTGDFDRSAGKFAVSGDSSTVYFTAEGEGNETLYRVPLSGGRVEPVGVLADGCTTSVEVGKGATVAVWERASNPPEIVEIDVEKKQHRLLSSFNAARVAQLDLPQVEHVWFTSAKGRRIHSILVKPPGFDPSKKYPLFVMLHGGPHTMARDAFSARWNYHLLSAPGYVFLMPNFTGSTGFGEAFSQAIQRDPLRTPAEEINQAADEAVKQFPFIDRERIAAGGASYGGHLANWLQATTARYRCLISHAGLVNLEAQWGTSDVVYSREVNNGGPIWGQSPVWREQNPIRYAGNHATKTGWVTPMLLTVGEQDFRVPLNNTLENWTYHQRLKIPSRLLVFPDENHWILKGENSKYWYGEIHGWLSRWLRAQ